MGACSPKAVSPRESTIEQTNGRGDVECVGVVLRSLENNILVSVLNELFPSEYVRATNMPSGHENPGKS